MRAWAGWGPAGLTDPRPARRSGSSLRRRRSIRVFRRFRVAACAVAVTVSFFLGVCVHYLPEQVAREQVSSEEETPVTLLVWTHPFGEFRQLPDCSEQYQIRGCALTDDAYAYPQVDAVLIHYRDIVVGTAELPPEPRPSGQKWIWMNYESPAHTHELRRFEGVFNLTMSYRMDSDIFLPYGYLVPRARANAHLFELSLSRAARSARSRDRFVAWVISNWSTDHARVSFYHRLRRFIRVDVFGAAGRPLPKGDEHMARLLGRYRFYLALENSQHTDYITEKLWNAVAAGAVPVVLGPSRQNYERFLPREAFIHVDDFPTVRELARYLLRLWREPVRMRRHLDWRRSYSLHRTRFWGEHYCTACRAVRRSRGRRDEVTHLSRWFDS